ncbi:MAG: hypothetical protein HOD97_05615 [Candidatus Marinimicrobia bacterium]|jgi:hypothetical protein|nr:hypothetical protein [Candidatus Neomarinimicrobiota bacterium]MBT3618779.1 hypothetical protein [Candidatus Neomarinimicrobiota bacterium]MBT3829474.1 hypothetical protein [Candidatus Neomarinimicrobiota bacterium]MBT3996680.1 hypothetical protein [Candidatus Neomarinimicrobiota bacterium]MBT4281070.1 hypothetical protein [Candidatus Neomarinimicrobiota bacterium]
MNRITFILLWVMVAGLTAQIQSYRQPDDIKNEWQDYTSFQKQELLSFCDFLSEEGFHDRALLAYFQFLYRYPGDPLEPSIYYRIAQSYEYTRNLGLARTYYDRVLSEADSGSVEFQAAEYKMHSLSLMEDDYDKILEKTVNSEDPYDLIFRGYAFFHKLDWISARQSFLGAEEKFDHQHYSDLLAPIFQAVDNAAAVKPKNRWISLAAAIVPGGGHAYLKQWDAASGSLISTVVLYSAMNMVPEFSQSGGLGFTAKREIIIPQSGGIKMNSGSYSAPEFFTIPSDLEVKTNNTKLFIPPLVLGLGIYIGSIWKTVHDVDEANLRLVMDFVSKVSKENPASDFMDFPTPILVIHP